MNKTNPEITQMLDADDELTMYREPWQYTTWQTTHKSPKEDENGKPLKEDPSDLSTLAVVRRSAYTNKFAVGVKEFSFNELIEATKQGHSLKRIGSTPLGTRFLVIDLDNDGNENISPEELDSFCNDRIRWTPGGSGRPYRYHLFVFLTAPIVTTQEFKEQSEIVLKRLAEHIGRFDRIMVDKHQFSFLQWCYGVPQNQLEHMEEETLPGTLYRCFQIRKKNGFRIEKVDPSVPETGKESSKAKSKEKDENKRLMPYNSAMLANMIFENRLSAGRHPDGSYINPMIFLEGKRFDIFEPRMKKQSIRKGKRFNVARSWIFRLIPQYFRCKLLGLEYTEKDLIHTFYTLCKRNFADFDSWWEKTGKSMVSGMVIELHSNDGLDYASIEEKYQPSHATELYKRRGYGMATTMFILDHFATVSPDEGSVIFPSRQDLQNLLAKVHISYPAFMGYLQQRGLKAVYQQDGRQSHQYDYILDTIAYTDGVYYYTRANEAEKCFCKGKHIPYLSMYRLFSGSKKEYKSILEVTDLAIAAMWEYFHSQQYRDHDHFTVPTDDDCDHDIPDDIPF